ncbi:MAG: hypothetical protein LKE46_11745 [Clostridium sp.]|nr:hypothetical protein [Clostridium sp.]MCH3964936.1 hypothetical protein [Clostridium sp.]MCI1716570.1 hypothetical protein [Clostridium sp.]MCI1800948.1 hypothetical protein [Clostridium sp.]MCI1814747.1 hypothetical protein [Clostridium sp.]MCI1871695.1 hypothetical protein [Clostridium sp.]
MENIIGKEIGSNKFYFDFSFSWGYFYFSAGYFFYKKLSNLFLMSKIII